MALVTLDKSAVEKIVNKNELSDLSWTDLVRKNEVESQVRKIIADTNAQLSSFESIKKFKILPEEFTVEYGGLTPSLKVKRKFLDQKFKNEINSLYSEH